MIHAKSLNKKFGNFEAVKDVSLEIKRGQCFGLLGPNGAGKSTFISMVYGMVLRSGGDLRVLGLDPQRNSHEIKKRIGVVTQENALDESLTVIENMMIYAAFLNIPKKERKQRVDELLEYMNLAHKKDERIQSLSGGMKRRLVFVRALLGRPEFLILDEPTTGLDPAVRHLLWGKVKELHQSGTTILLTTHYMHEAEVLCDELVIMNQGQVIAKGSPQEMITEHAKGFVGVFPGIEEGVFNSALNQIRFIDFYQDTSGFYLRVNEISDLTAAAEILAIRPLQIRPGNLEDVFLKLTGKDLSHDA